jgi:cytochrome c556
MACVSTLALGMAGAIEPRAKSIKEVMALHKGPRATLGQLKTALGAASPDWSKLKDLASDYSTKVADLDANDPPKGDTAGFKKQAVALEESAKALLAAAEKKDKAAASKAVGAIGKSCMPCHKAHRQ